jgi:FMN phosphatase YigB (HAD superfamily)
MLGDRERDLIPAKMLGMKTVLVDNFEESEYADDYALDLKRAVEEVILKG